MKSLFRSLSLSAVVVLCLVALTPLAGARSLPAQPVFRPLLSGSVVNATPPQLQPTSFEVVAQGLSHPRGMTFGSDGALYIAEAGVGGPNCITLPDGTVICWGPSGQVTRVADGQQSVFSQGFISLAFGQEAVGLHDVAFDPSGHLYGIVGLGADPAMRDPGGIFGADGMNFGQIVAFHEDGTWQNLFDVAAYEGTANPDGGLVDSNPYALFAYGDGIVAADAGGNDLLHVAITDGLVSTLAVFPARMVEFPPGSGNMIPMEAVPTSIQMDANHDFFVGELTGFPFPMGGANIYHVAMGGAPTVYADQFTNVIDIALGPDGSLYVLEMIHFGLMSGSPFGALYRIAPDGTRAMITGDLFFPTGLAYGPDGALYVAEYGVMPGMGRVVRIGIVDSVMVEPDTAVVGDTVTVHAHAMNFGGDATGVLHIVPLDRNLVSYVDGSVFGGAIPLATTAAEAAQAFRTDGAAALRPAAPGDEVVAVAWLGNQMTGEEVHFGFQATVALGAAGVGADFTLSSYQMNTQVASGWASLNVPALHQYELTLQNGVDGYSGASDTFLDAWAPMMGYGSDANFYVRQPGVKSGLARFDLTGVSNVAHVSQAQVGFWVTYGSGNAVTLEAYEVYKAWSEAEATWMQADAATAWEVPGAMGGSDRSSDAADRVSFGGSGRWVWFDVTDLAQGWVANPDSNHGILLMGSGSTNSELEFTSSDYIVGFVRPQFKIIYQAP